MWMVGKLGIDIYLYKGYNNIEEHLCCRDELSELVIWKLDIENMRYINE